jgi:hypothetical protein
MVGYSSKNVDMKNIKRCESMGESRTKRNCESSRGMPIHSRLTLGWLLNKRRSRNRRGTFQFMATRIVSQPPCLTTIERLLYPSGLVSYFHLLLTAILGKQIGFTHWMASSSKHMLPKVTNVSKKPPMQADPRLFHFSLPY